MFTSLRNLFVFLLALASMAIAQECDANPTRDGDIVRYEGPINHAASAALRRSFDEGARHLHINSNGGDVAAGLSIARKMRELGVSVKVLSYCMSSCANYVFLAGLEKSLAPQAILGFHGGPITGALPRPTFPEQAGDLGGLRDTITGSYEFYDEIKFDLALIDRSEELTRVPEGGEVMVVESNGGKKRSFSDRAAGTAWMKKLAKEGRLKSMAQRSTLDNTVYFPDEVSLSSCGVTGLASYPYPASEQALRRQAAKIDLTLNVVGDFRVERGAVRLPCSRSRDFPPFDSRSRHTR